MKQALIAILVLLLVVVGLYGVYLLEESAKGIRTVVVENHDGKSLFVVEMQKRNETDILIQCHESEFQDAFQHFARFLGVTIPPVTVPGGAFCVALGPEEVPDALKPAARAAVEVLKRHSPRRIILVAHSDCLVYDAIAAWQDHRADVSARQEADLRKAVRILGTWFPKAQIEVYYAHKEGDRLKFDPFLVPEERTKVGEKLEPLQGEKR